MRCKLCGNTQSLERHHLIFGRGRRELSEKYNLVDWLCGRCHRKVHMQRNLMDWSKQEGQKRFEKEYGREEYMRVFGRNYLE